MKKKLHLLYFLPALLIGMLFSSCEKKYYTTEYIEVDPSYDWDTLPYTIDSQGTGGNLKWLWNQQFNRYECMVNINGDFQNVDEYIYNNGFYIGYVYMGTQYQDETQNQMPFYDETIGANLWCATSIRGSQKDFNVHFYFQWNDGRQQLPPYPYNLKLVLGWGKVK